MVEKFTKKQFEDALPLHKNTAEPLWESLGLIAGEYVYRVSISDKVSILIRSSVQTNGMSADTGQDSIRMWLVDNSNDKPLGAKLTKWTTRRPGWKTRMTNILRQLWMRASQAGNCPSCYNPRSIFQCKQGQNKGKVFCKCVVCNNYFNWLDDS